MSAEWKGQRALAGAFTPRQIEALGAAIGGATEGLATRAELERLEAMVRELLARTAPRSAEEQVEPEVPADVTDEEIVLIAAAVTSFLGTKVRVRGARRIPPPAPTASAWGLQGRVFIQASHAVGPRRGR